MTLLERPPLKVVENPDDDGYTKPPQELVTKLRKWMTSRNIATDLDEVTLSALGSKVVREYRLDDSTRSDWKSKTEDAMKLAMQVAMKKMYPWPGASNVIFPLMTSAAIQFAARAYPAIIANKNIVRGLVVGRDEGTPEFGPLGPKVDPQTQQPVWRIRPGEKAKRAKDIGDHMSWQLLEEQPEWEPEMDQMLHILPIVGCAFKKSFFDPGKGRNASLLVSAMNLVVNYYAKSLETAPRITELLDIYPLEVREKELSDLFLTIEYGTEAPRPGGEPSNAGMDDDAPRRFLEQHRYEDLDGDGYREPYIVTVHEGTGKVVRIVARYDEDGVKVLSSGKIGKIMPIHYYTQYNFLPNPEGGIYGIGFGQLLRPLNDGVNTTLNQLIDAGHLANTGGGFVGKQLSMNAGTLRFSPGEFKVVNASGVDVRASVVQLQFTGPSEVLFKLLGLLIDAGKEIASVKDVLMGEQQNSNVPATTTLALIEQGLKVFSGIYKRIYRSLKSELGKLYRLNSVYMDTQAEFQVGDEWRVIQQEDYLRGAGVAPISDPTMITDMQKAARSQLLLSFKDDPLLSKKEIFQRVFDVAGVERIDALWNTTPPPVPPEVAIAAMDLEIRGKRYNSQEVLDIARAIQTLSKAMTDSGEANVKTMEQFALFLQQQNDQNDNTPSVPGAPDYSGANGGQVPLAPAPKPGPSPVLGNNR